MVPVSYTHLDVYKRQPILYRYRVNALNALLEALRHAHELLATSGTPQLHLSSGFPQGIAVEDETALHAFFREKAEQELKQGFSLYGCLLYTSRCV